MVKSMCECVFVLKCSLKENTHCKLTSNKKYNHVIELQSVEFGFCYYNIILLRKSMRKYDLKVA